MSKKVLIQQIQPVAEGPVYGPISDPVQLVKSQEYAHEHIENIVKAFLVSGCGETPQIFGFEYTLIGGLNIRIFAPGEVTNLFGRTFEMIGTSHVDVPLATAHATNPRIDLIYAKLETAEAESVERPFIRLRTLEEREAGIAPYPPQQFNEPTELHTRAVVMFRTGVPDAQPQVPAVASDEVPLYEVHVAPNAAALTTSDVFDARERIRTLRCAWTEIDKLIALVNQLQRADHDHPARRIFIEGIGPYSGKNVQDFIDDQSARADDEYFDPLIPPELVTPELAPSDVNAGTLVSTGDVSSSIPIVDFPVGREIIFSNASYKITPERFPNSSNARIRNKHVSAGTDTDTKQTAFSLPTINSIESDGGGEFDQQDFDLPIGRTKSYHGGRMMAARDGRYFELFGGSYPNGSNSWFTIDTVSKTVTQRAFTGDVPSFSIIFAAPTGTGNILIAERGGADLTAAGFTLRWYVVNATTGVATRLASGPGVEPAPTQIGYPGVVGDLCQPNVIVVAVSAHGIATENYYAFHVGTSNFELLTTIGQRPTGFFAAGQHSQRLRDIDACFLQQGKLLFVEAHSQVQSFEFDYPTRSFTRLPISQPVAQVNSGVKGISLANMQGRVYLTGEFFCVWEFTPGVTKKWTRLNTALDTGSGTRGIAGLVGLLAEGLPKGKGYVVGGIVSQPGVARSVKKDVWEFQPAGIVETVCDGEPAITLGNGATQASFNVPLYTVPFAVAKLLVNLKGHLPQGSIKLSYSFDGTHFQDVPREAITAILNSDNPAPRTLRITLIGVGSVKPCLVGMTERFEKVGGPGFNQLVVTYDAVTAGVRGLYMDRFGVITIEADIRETTADKALLHIVTPTGPTTAPTVKDVIQQRLVHRKFTGTHSGTNPTITNRLPRRPRFVQAFRIVSGAMQTLADPTIEFNNTITITGLSNGDSFRLEVQA